MWRAGKHNAQTAPGRNPLWNTRARDEKGQEIFIPVRDAASYITEEFYMALEVFCATENMGCLPFSGGWAEQPAWITQALSVLKVERWKADEEELEIKRQDEEAERKHVRREKNP